MWCRFGSCNARERWYREIGLNLEQQKSLFCFACQTLDYRGCHKIACLDPPTRFCLVIAPFIFFCFAFLFTFLNSSFLINSIGSKSEKYIFFILDSYYHLVIFRPSVCPLICLVISFLSQILFLESLAPFKSIPKFRRISAMKRATKVLLLWKKSFFQTLKQRNSHES